MKKIVNLKIIAIIALVFISFVMVYLVARHQTVKEAESLSVQEEEVPTENEMTEKWAEGTISYNGHHYIYNSNLKNYIFMGIDVDGPVTEAEDYQSGGQSDAMFIFSVDEENEKVKVLAINRNAMTDVEMFDTDGNPLGIYEAQLCTQHGFGDGKNYSCNLTVKAVEKLMYQLPIDGYYALNLDGIKIINDYVGGVELQVLPGLEFLNDNRLVTGETVLLDGNLAYSYLRRRDINEYASADLRLARQKQYISLLIPKLAEKIKDNSKEGLKLTEELSDYVVSNMDLSRMLTDLSSNKIDFDNMYEVPGHTQTGDDGYEQYIVDDNELYQVILDVFYQKLD